MAEALIVRNLSKRFGGLRAVQDLSFSVNEYETVALIGPNGSGKTTSFHLITGFHRPDQGSVTALAARSSDCDRMIFARMGWRGHFRWPDLLAV
jgi:ABC-type branched-subunit amino acid transport system ATPase component